MVRPRPMDRPNPKPHLARDVAPGEPLGAQGGNPGGVGVHSRLAQALALRTGMPEIISYL